jgi:UDP-N-acetylmuramate dehydrogenase
MATDKKYNRFQETFGLLSREPMSNYTSFRVGGPADLLAIPRDRQALSDLLFAAKKESIPVTLMGSGTNTLVSDKGIQGLVIVLTNLKSAPSILETADTPENTKTAPPAILRADAGERLSTLCQFALDQGFAGLESAAGIPGTLGGAIMMNAGTGVWDISQIIFSVDVIDTQTLSFQTLEKKDLVFSYRRLNTADIIIVGAHLTLIPADPATLKKTFEQTLKTKKDTQPVSLASAGCFFKNPAPRTPAGKLIEDAGLKGIQINGARISELHANFIVNTGSARCEDIIALKNLVQKTVFEKYQIKLETEVKVIGG